MHRTEPYKPVAFEAPTSNGRRVRFTAHVHPALSFDACDPVTGEALGRIHVWDANPELAKRPRMLDSHPWNLDSRVEVEIVAFDSEGEFQRAGNARVGMLAERFDFLIAVSHWEQGR